MLHERLNIANHHVLHRMEVPSGAESSTVSFEDDGPKIIVVSSIEDYPEHLIEHVEIDRV